jgi:hypothetical protein
MLESCFKGKWKKEFPAFAIRLNSNTWNVTIIYMIFTIVQYQLYNGRSVARQYTGAARADPFHQHQLVSSILCPPGYQGMGSPAKHVTVVAQQPPPQLQIQPPIISQQVIVKIR